jgi:hypothetical protein
MTHHPYRASGPTAGVARTSAGSVVADIARAVVMLALAGMLVDAVKRISALDPLAVVRML